MRGRCLRFSWLFSVFVVLAMMCLPAQAFANTAREQWVNQYPNFSANAIATDNIGNAIITGADSSTGDGLTIKLDPNGNLLWEARYALPQVPGYWNEGIGITVDANRNVYVTGSSWIGHDTYFTAKYTENGILQWLVNHDSLQGCSPKDIILDQAGNIYVTGTFTIKYDNNGNEIWVLNATGKQLILDATVISMSQILYG